MSILDAILTWAHGNSAVRAVIMTGSRAAGAGHIDVVSDYDLAFFVTDPSLFLQESSWIRLFDDVVIEIADSISVAHKKTYHTRLVIFKDGIKVDFAFFTTDVLKDIEQHNDLRIRFVRAFSVLLDKDAAVPDLFVLRKLFTTQLAPSVDEYNTIIQEFFFEAYHVAKYLYRGELWTVELRAAATRTMLLKMLEWQAKAINGWDFDTLYDGKNIRAWLDQTTYKKLPTCFAGFESDAQLIALSHTIKLFRESAQLVGEKLNYTYPQAIDLQIVNYIKRFFPQISDALKRSNC